MLFGGGGRWDMLSQRLLPVLRERFLDRGLVEGRPPDPCAAFPGLHPGIRQVAVFDDGDELTVVLDDLTHGHFSDYDYSGAEGDREQRIVDAVVDFLDDLFADRMAVWGQHAVSGGWYRVGVDELNHGRGQLAFLWSGPLTQRRAEPGATADGGGM
jgi:hypothetical protein